MNCPFLHSVPRPSIAGLALAALLATLPAASPAVSVRIASWNILSGLDSSSDAADSAGTRNDDWWQVIDALDRVRPDIVGFAELNNKDFSRLPELAAALGYPYYALSSEPMNNGEYRQGVMSKFEITSSLLVKENTADPDAREIKRWPIHATIAVPGALNPLHVFVVHTHPGTATKQNALLRAMNAWRMRQYLDRMAADLPEDVEYVVMGDFNEDAYSGEVKWDSFDYAYYTNRLAAGAPFGDWFQLGNDFPWATNHSATIPYRPYPTDCFGAMAPLADTFRTGLEADLDRTTYPKTEGRVLDYILFSDEILQSAYGAPQCEVYWAANDRENNPPGLSKPGPWLDTLHIGSELTAAKDGLDHLMVFGDFHMIDAVAGLSPVAIISEVATVTNHNSANFVEISNTGAAPLDVTGYALEFYYRGNSAAAFTLPLATNSIPAGGSWWAAPRADYASNYWASVLAAHGLAWRKPDHTSSDLYNLDGCGAVVLRNASGAILDVYGVPGIDGSGKTWQYSNADATRRPGITEPITVWNASEWTIAGLSAATPGHHESVSEADADVSALALSPAAPAVGADFALSATVTPNPLASNLAVTAHFSIDGSDWSSGMSMTNASGNAWSVFPVSLGPAPGPGDLLSALVEVSFDGPGGNSPVFSHQFDYIFPGLTNGFGKLLSPLFNEVAPGPGFVELVGPADLLLDGWTVEHWRIAEGDIAPLWTNAFSGGATIPGTSGFRDEWGNPVGFATLDTANAPLVSNAPAALVLRSPQGIVADAVAWGPSGSACEVDFLPDTVLSTNVAQGLPNYLHVLGPAPSFPSDSLQAPNWVLAGRSTDALANLVQWTTATATAASPNTAQTNGALRLVRVDRDADSLLDDEDNCPSEHNPTQADIDGDGLGDDCDPDMDGDSIPNALDNCPYTFNPAQEDDDSNGIGDACDDDFDPALLPPAEAFFVTFESVSPSATFFADGGRDWSLAAAAVTGDPDTPKIGAKSLRLDPGGTLTLSGALTNGLASVAFFAASAADGSSTNLVVETSSDGTSWEYLFHPVLSPHLASVRYAPSALSSAVHFRIRLDSSASAPVLLDNLRLVSNVRATACADLESELTVTYDGCAHTNSFTVTPATASWSVSYTNAVGKTVSAPSSVGSWSAVLTVADTEDIAGGTFVFPNSLVIEDPVLPPDFGDFDFTAEAVSAALSGTVNPHRSAGISVIFEYGTSTHFGNKIVAEPSSVSGTDPVPVFVLLEGLSPTTRYYWRILAGDAASDTQTFTTDELPVPAPFVSITNATEFLVEWPSVAGATNYVLSVLAHSAGGTNRTITETFSSWTYYYNYFSGGSWGSHASSSYHTQETGAGTWSSTNASVLNTGGASSPGSKGYVAIATGGWLQTPPLANVAEVAFAARTSNGSGTLALQVSEDGGTTFSEAASIALTKNAVWKTNAWSAPLPAGAVLRFANAGTREIRLHDLSILESTATSSPVSGYPANVSPAESAFIVSNLSPSTAYSVAVTAQGSGWESDASALLEVTTPAADAPDDPYAAWIASLSLPLASYPPDADSDGDGISNRQEYLAGTAPNNPASLFDLSLATPTLSPSNVVWTFPGSTSRVYQLITSSNLVAWVTNSLSPDPATGEVSFTNSLFETLFSRLRASPPASP